MSHRLDVHGLGYISTVRILLQALQSTNLYTFTSGMQNSDLCPDSDVDTHTSVTGIEKTCYTFKVMYKYSPHNNKKYNKY